MAKTYGNFTDFVDFSRSSGGTALRRVSYGSELVTNGTFDTDTSGWSSPRGNSTLSVSSGKLRSTASAAGAYGAVQTLTGLTAGAVYSYSSDVFTGGGSGLFYFRISAVSTLDDTPVNITGSSDFSTNGTFVATASTMYVGVIHVAAAGGDYAEIDNISVKEVTFDQPSGDLVLFNHPDDIPRVEYDSNGTVKGLLIEEARTNRVLYSQNTSNWDEDGTTTITNSTQAAPDGTSTATLIDIGSTGSTLGPNRISLAGSGFTAGDTLTASVFLKVPSTSAADVVNVRVYCSGTTPTDAQVDFDTSDFTASFQSSVVDTIHSAEDYGNGWYRVAFTFTLDATATGGFNFRVGGTISGSATDTDFIMWGAQLEIGAFPTSYIPTTGSTKTRSADIASIDVANFGYNKAAGTVVVEASSFGVVSGTTNRFLCFNNGTSAERMNLFVESNSALMFYVADGYVAQAALNSGETATNNVVFNVSGAYKQNNFAVSANGSSAVTDTSGTLPAITQVQIGSELNALPLNGHLKSIKYLPRRLTNTQLQEQSA